MAYTTIDDPSVYFQIGLYTGNGNNNKNINLGSPNFTGEYVGQDIQPDLVWIKQRTGATRNHNLTDSSRGVTKHLSSDLNEAEATASNRFKSFDSNGFTLGDSGYTNDADDPFVAWVWKANGGTTTTNDASSTGVGDIDSVYQANTTAGFSIVTYTHTGNDDRVAHGLGVTPKVVIIKERGGAGSWYYVTTQYDGSLDYLLLESKNAKGDLGYNTHASTTFASLQFDNNDTAVAYCFAEIQGYSKFGNYTGNGNAEGPFIYTGFKPAWVMIKNANASFGSDNSWIIQDSKRNPTNKVDNFLYANTSRSEGDADFVNMDFLSNGFKLYANEYANNYSGDKMIYMAFAEHPFVSSKGVPTTAR